MLRSNLSVSCELILCCLYCFFGVKIIDIGNSDKGFLALETTPAVHEPVRIFEIGFQHNTLKGKDNNLSERNVAFDTKSQISVVFFFFKKFFIYSLLHI